MKTATNRREFLRLLGRGTLLGIGALGSARLVVRRQVTANGQRCGNQGICAGCAARDGCGLPAALSRRRALERRAET